MQILCPVIKAPCSEKPANQSRSGSESKHVKHNRGFNNHTTLTSLSNVCISIEVAPPVLPLQISPWILTHPKEACAGHAMKLRQFTNDVLELINIHTAFHAGAYQQVLDFDTSSFSSSNALPVRVLKARSQIALGQAQAVSSELSSEKTPDLIAVKLLADLEQGKDVTDAAKKLAGQHGQENLAVQIIGGIILERAGETEDALALLSKHQGSLDA